MSSSSARKRCSPFLATLPIWFLACGGVSGATNRFGSDATLYGSFDARPGAVLDVDPSLPRPARGLQIVMSPGAEGVYPAVDFSRAGTPLVYQCGLVPVADGRFGQAVRLGEPGAWGRHALVVDGIGNLFAEQGTIAFWARFTAHCPPDNVSGYLLNVGSMSCHAYLGVYIERGRRIMAFVSDAFGERHELTAPIASAGLQPGQWSHFALVWDHASGLALYVNGKACLSSLGRQPWHTRDRIEGLSLGHMRRTNLAGHLGGYESFKPGTVIDFDELVAFSRPLAAEEVLAIHEGNRLTARQPAADGAPDWPRHRAGLFGWGAGDGLPRIPACSAGAERPPVVRQIEIRNAYAVKRATHAVLDNQWRTAWVPGMDHRYSVGSDRLRFQLPAGQDYNFIRAVATDLPATAATTSDDGDGETAFELPVGQTRFQRVALATPRRHTEFELRAKTGRLHDLALFLIDAGGQAGRPAPEAPTRLHPVALTADAPGVAPPGRRPPRFSAATQHADPRDRTLVRWDRQPRPGPFRADLPAGQFLHFDAPEPDGMAPVDSIELDIWLEGLDAPTRIWAGLPEPTLRERYLFEFDWLLIPPAKAGPARLWLRLEFPGIVVQPGQALRISLMADRDLVLADAPGRRSSLRLWASDPGRATDAFYENQLHVVRDTFDDASQPRQWVFGGAPHQAVPALGSMIQHLEALGRIRSDWRAAGVYSLLTTNMRAPWDGGFGRQPFVPADVFRDASPLPRPTDGHPPWAFWWREVYQRMRGVVDWWIDQRQIHTGEFGGAYSDDTDMVHEWANLAMIWDGDGKLADSFCRLSDFCWRERNLDGLSIYRNDSDLHAYEEGMNIHGGTLLFRYGDPVYYNRVMTLAQHADGNLTGINAKGQRLFRNQVYTAHGSQRGQAQDDGLFFRMEPLLWLVWYNRHPEASRVLREWMDTRLAYIPAGNPSGWPGILRFADGEELPASTIYLSFDALWLLARHGGDAKYIAPVMRNMERLLRDPGSMPTLATGLQEHGVRIHAWGEAQWARFGLFGPVREASWWPAFRAAHLTSPFRRDPYAAEARAAAVAALEAAVRLLDDRRSVLTWIGQSPDRVFMSGWPAEFFAMALGGVARSRNSAPIPQHAVSFDAADGNVARWVLNAQFDALAVAFYNFHDAPRAITLRPWLLTHGEYEVREGVDADGDFRGDAPTARRATLRRYDLPLRVTLPPRAVYVVEATLQRPLPEGDDRPDAAISASDVEWIPAIPALRIPVHNIGRGPVENLPVRVLDTDTGRVLWETRVRQIAAPDDLAPKTVLLFTGRLDADGVRRVAVQLDPAGEVSDFTRANNHLAFTLPAGPRRDRSPWGEPLPVPPFGLGAQHGTAIGRHDETHATSTP